MNVFIDFHPRAFDGLLECGAVRAASLQDDADDSSFDFTYQYLSAVPTFHAATTSATLNLILT